MRQRTEDIGAFLKETKYCNYNHRLIKDIAEEFKNKNNGERELSVALFYYVRDKILYRVGHWNNWPSDTLSEGKGVCTSKANLLVSLLRCVGIPAGYGVMRVNAQEYFGPIMPKMFKNMVSEYSIHVYCFVYLDNRWIKCDPSDDKMFSDKISYFNPPSTLVDWDGFNDAVLNLDERYILKDMGPIDNIDYIISKKPRNARGIPLKVANLYIEFLRQNDKKIESTEDLEELFKPWLKKNYLFYYYLYFLATWSRGFKLKLFK